MSRDWQFGLNGFEVIEQLLRGSFLWPRKTVCVFHDQFFEIGRQVDLFGKDLRLFMDDFHLGRDDFILVLARCSPKSMRRIDRAVQGIVCEFKVGICKIVRIPQKSQDDQEEDIDHATDQERKVHGGTSSRERMLLYEIWRPE